jgi:hypothetical protein
MRAALDKRVAQPGFRVVPVLLPGAAMPVRGALSRFLSRHTWVDFRGSAGIHDTEAFYRLVAGIRGIVPRHLATNTSSERSGECPYRGLEVFDEAHARFFFGREAITQHLVEGLRTTRFLAVLGPSGSGKSSVVRAGLLPQLRAGALPLSTHWYYLVLKPGAHPLEELALHLARAGKYEHPLEQMPVLLKSLASDERALHWHVRLALTEQPHEARFCIIVDQFEEVFTLCQDREEREQFIHILRYATILAGGQTVVVITLRADFLTRAAEYPSLAEMLSSYQFIVSLMDDDDLQQAIAAPAQLVGSQLEEGLVDVILRDVGHEPGLLPLMEHALTQLWEKRRHDHLMTLQAYSEIGGVQGALAKRANALFDAFSPEQQQMARRILLRLTQPGEGTEGTRRRTTMTELRTRAEEQPVLEQVVKTLTDARLLVMSTDQQVDIAHEALIRGWPRLRRWVDDSRATLRTHRRITEAAQEWQQLHHDEGVLLRGALLVQAQAWREQHEEDLNPLERDFLDTSIALKRREEEAEEERRAHELLQAHTLAKAERQRAEVQARASKRLRWLVGLLSVVALLAVGRQCLQEDSSGGQHSKPVSPPRASWPPKPFITWMTGLTLRYS